MNQNIDLSAATTSARVAAPARPIAEQAAGPACSTGKDLGRPSPGICSSRSSKAGSSQPLMAAAFVALRMKGETAEELIGAAMALRAAARLSTGPIICSPTAAAPAAISPGSINVSTAGGLRRRRLRAAGGQARQPFVHLEMRVRRRARGARRAA